jgi:CRP-like cAMP-binding protein
MLYDLDDDERAKVEAIGVPRKFAAGELMIHEGREEHSFYLIQAGSVEVRKVLAPGRFKKLTNLYAGTLVGEMGFLGASPRTANVLVTEECSTLEFTHERFRKILDANPAIALKVYRWMARELAKRLAQSDEQLADAIVWGMSQAQAAAAARAQPPK